MILNIKNRFFYLLNLKTSIKRSITKVFVKKRFFLEAEKCRSSINKIIPLILTKILLLEFYKHSKAEKNFLYKLCLDFIYLFFQRIRSLKYKFFLSNITGMSVK